MAFQERLHWTLLLVVLSSCFNSSQAFSSGLTFASDVRIQSRDISKLSMEVSPFSMDSKALSDNGNKDDPIARFKVGGVVRVVAKGLKAYQISPQGYGSYDADKSFVPAPDNSERKKKNLAIPVGLRGVVTTVIDLNEISANFPVQVKFEPGEHTDEGYDPPVAFTMHLSPVEIELC